MPAALGRGCRAITHHPSQLGTHKAAKRPELGTEVVAFEANMDKATALLSPAPASATATPQLWPRGLNKTSPKKEHLVSRVTFWSHFQPSRHPKGPETPFFLLTLCFKNN